MDAILHHPHTRGWHVALDRLRARLSGKRTGEVAPVKARNARNRIALWAIAISLVTGAIELYLPLEDAYRAIRAQARARPASQSAMVVFVDDRSLNALGVNDPNRADDAVVVERLFAAGATRIFFDRAYADATRVEDDQKLIDAFERHRGRVFIGAAPDVPQSDGSSFELLPHPRFRSKAEILTLAGWEGPFGLSTVFPTSWEILGRERLSISAKLANLDRPGGRYRVDWAIDHKTIPTVSYIDVLNGKVGAGVAAGKDIVVAPSSRTSSDFHNIPFGRRMHGALLHVMGADTLRKGYPADLGWLPAFLAVCVFLWSQTRRRRPSTRAALATGGALLLVPFALDFAAVNLDVMAAMVCLLIGATRLNRLARATYRGSTDIQTIDAMHKAQVDEGRDVIALKIRNFATISASLTPDQVEELLAKAQIMLRATVSGGEFSFEKDTFVWLQPRLPRQDLEDHLRGLHALFSTSISVGAQAPDVASSIGADVDHHAPLRERTESAIQCAEDAAHSGRIYLVGEPRRVEERVWRLQILSELENAIRNDDVNVLYQPKVSLANNTIIGAEALLRWNHPTRGMIEPSQVVTIAEEHNRVDMITRFVLNRALSQARSALAVNPAFKIAINISALDLRDPMFVDQVEHLLAAYRFPAANVVLEITETAPIENDQAIAANFAGLKRLGVKLSVDDFGIGHASLHYLRRIPADEVKIDRSFVTGMDLSNEDRALVRTSIEMIHSLGRTAVAEGVETQEVVSLLRDMGCDAAQGYFFARPIAMADLVERIRANTIAA